MKLSIIASVFAAAVSTMPNVFLDPTQDLGHHEAGRIQRDDLKKGESDSCPPVIFLYARGSTEPGNLGSLGPVIAHQLEAKYHHDGIWIQGVGGDYKALLGDNSAPRGTSRLAIDEMVRLFELADRKCPKATIIVGGYSQGAALAAASITDVDPKIRTKIAGVVLFGYTQNKQNDGKIPKYPADRTDVFCNKGDLVCHGQLIVAAPHLAYGVVARDEAPPFLINQVHDLDFA